MAVLIPTERKSTILTPSGLACLSAVATVNLTAGCLHGCAYCYTRGYSIYPGDQVVKLYTNLPEKLADELKRKRKLPERVYFSPSSDLFQPHEGIRQIALRVLSLLLTRGIRIAFLTKGVITEPIFDLFAEHANLVSAQIGLISTDESLLCRWEPHAAPRPPAWNRDAALSAWEFRPPFAPIRFCRG